MSSADQIKQDLIKKARLYADVFSTPNGQRILEELEKEFEPVQIFDENPHKTSYNAGRRDVVQYIKQMMRFNNVNS